MNVSFERLEKFGLEQHCLEVQPFEGIALDHLHYRRGEKLANIVEPAGDPRRRRTKPAFLATTLLSPTI